MFDLIAFATALTIASGALYAYWRTRDAMHPAIIVAPVLGYVYGVWPLVINYAGDLERLFVPEELEYVAWLYLVSVMAFYVGMCRLRKPAFAVPRVSQHQFMQGFFSLAMTPSVRKRLFTLAIALGIVAWAAYGYMIENVGGFLRAYSRYKGGGWASSGYIGEAVLLSFPAILLLALSRQGTKKVPVSDVLLALAIALPHLFQGTFGGRRGPLFLVLLVLLLAWYIARGQRPSLRKIVLGIAVIGLAVVVLQSQRRHIYLGSQGGFQAQRIVTLVRASEHLKTNDYVTGVSTVLTADYFDDFYLGKRYFVTIFVRPIPKQLWPTKYEDVGADWLTRYDPTEGGSEMLQAVGFLPAAGSAPGFIADIYHEFAWGGVIVVYLFGRGLSGLWRRHSLFGGIWTIVFAEAMILCVYLPTQSFSAWFHRFLFMSVISALVWRYWIGPTPRVFRSHNESQLPSSDSILRK